MQISCTLKRADGTEVEIDGVTYLFAPEDKTLKPGTPEYLAAPHVCDVTVAAHVKKFLRISEAYEVVMPDDPAAAKAFTQEARDESDGQSGEEETSPKAQVPSPVAKMDKLSLAEYVTTTGLDVKLNLSAPLSTLRKQVMKALADKEAAAAKQREVAIRTAERDEAKTAFDAETDEARKAALKVELDKAQAALDTASA